MLTAVSSLALVAGEKTRKGEVNGDSSFHDPTKVIWELAWVLFFFLSGRPAGLKQLLGAPTQLALGNFFHKRERWRTQDPNEVFLYSVPNLPGSWAALRAYITRMILRRSMGRETTVFGSQLFLPTLPGEAGAWNQQTILPLNWYRKLVWRKEKFLSFQWPFASIHSQRIYIYHI